MRCFNCSLSLVRGHPCFLIYLLVVVFNNLVAGAASAFAYVRLPDTSKRPQLVALMHHWTLWKRCLMLLRSTLSAALTVLRHRYRLLG